MTTMNNEDPADPSVHEPHQAPMPCPFCGHAEQCNADGECTTGCDERKKKPLTKQELIRLWREPYKNEDHDSWFVEFARAVERAHGITGETK